MNEPIPDLWLEKLALGELPAEQEAELRRRLGDELPARLAATRASDEAVLADYPPAAMISAIERRAAQRDATRPGEARSRWLWPSVVAVVTIVIALLVWRSRGSDLGDDAPRSDESVGPIARVDRPDVDEPVRIKGDAKVVLSRIEAGGRVSGLAADAKVATGDVLRIEVVPGAASHGVLVSIDGRGMVTLHHPATARDSTAIQGRMTVPHTYELDDAPGFERFVLVTASSPIDVEAVLEAARKLGSTPGADAQDLGLPADYEQTSLRVLK